jgi:two-component system chemotaxis sensor kinase CheA
MDHLQSTFITEAAELLSDLEGVLLEFDKDLTNKDSIEAIFRAMHTIKGSASMFGFDHLSALTHDLETIYDKIREGQFKVTAEILEITLQAVDHLNKIIKDKNLTDPANQITHRELLSSIKTIVASVEVNTESPALFSATQPFTYYILCKPRAEIFKSGSNPLYLMDDLAALGPAIILPRLDQLPSLADIDPEVCYTSFEILLVTAKAMEEIKDVFIFVDHVCDVMVEKISSADLLASGPFTTLLQNELLTTPVIGLEKIKSMAGIAGTATALEINVAPSAGSTKGAHTTSIRVSSEKLDELMNLISELVTSQARLSLLAQQNNFPELTNLSENMEKITRRLRDNAFNICLIPLQTVETRFQRLVRDLSKDLGKEILFTAEGAETELDKSIIEKVTDPILHILRNCIDHGIELPEERIKKGKKGMGHIEMKAFHSGTSVYIQIKDDGKGIDPERIKAKAIEKGLVAEEALLSKDEVLALIFHPGFSTAEKVTDVSGRGVGMDIVKRNIEAIHGEVTLHSTLHEGTTITIKLPLTLSIVDGMLVKIAASEYILPLTSVDKCYEIRTEKLKGLSQKVVLDGTLIPVFNLREAFHEHDGKPEITQIIKVHYDRYPVCITVDAVLGEYQAVMKPLGSLYSKHDEFSGATILGDGTVALVMDTTKLIRQLSSHLI